jgi:hypothetical protein
MQIQRQNEATHYVKLGLHLVPFTPNSITAVDDYEIGAGRNVRADENPSPEPDREGHRQMYTTRRGSFA